MKQANEIIISVYSNVYSKQPVSKSLQEVLGDCLRPVYEPLIRSIRRYHEEGRTEDVQQLKKKLPCFTPSGEFDGAHAIRNLRRHSNVICLDYDHVDHRLEMLRKIAEDEHTLCVLESPTDGLKVFVYVEQVEGHHREAQALVSRYYRELTGLESDMACKDESRLCYFTHSPNGYLAGLCQPFEFSYASGSKNAEAEARQTADTGEKAAAEPTYISNPESVEKFFSSYHFIYPFTPGQRHTHLFRMACEACRQHYDPEVLCRISVQFFKGSDFPENEIRKTLHDGYKHITSSFGETSSASDAGESARSALVHVYAHKNDNQEEDKEEAYWEGEELREKTPCFPDEVYRNLPEILQDSISLISSRRERDVALLSLLTCLSADMPHTSGLYRRKNYSPHLFSIVIAPSGSGKASMLLGQYLLEKINNRIYSQSQRENERYEHEHQQWMHACKHAKDSAQLPPEPKQPPLQSLIIPGTTSYTRMQLQMRDNAEMGSLIFDTEAQSLSTANKQDYGNFDDLLRKAFEHERISSSYKTNGREPIIIPYPRLAMMLSGTTSQFDLFFQCTEKGLPSRTLMYTYRTPTVWSEMQVSGPTLEEEMEPQAEAAEQLFDFCREYPAYFQFTHKQGARHTTFFKKLLSDCALIDNDDLPAVLKRYGGLSMRLSMIFARLRQFEAHNTDPNICCTDEDFERALQMVNCCYEHCKLILTAQPMPERVPLKKIMPSQLFLNRLADRFSTEDAIAMGKEMNIKRRTVLKYLSAAVGSTVERENRGWYKKLSFS